MIIKEHFPDPSSHPACHPLWLESKKTSLVIFSSQRTGWVLLVWRYRQPAPDYRWENSASVQHRTYLPAIGEYWWGQVRSQVRSGPSFQGLVRMTETSLVLVVHIQILIIWGRKKLCPAKSVPNICKLTWNFLWKYICVLLCKHEQTDKRLRLVWANNCDDPPANGGDH